MLTFLAILGTLFMACLTVAFVAVAAFCAFTALVRLPFRLLKGFRERRLAAVEDCDFDVLVQAEPLPGEYPSYGGGNLPHYPNGMEYREPTDADV